MTLTFDEFFYNLKDLPPEGSDEFHQLVEWEIEKCMGGVTVDGVFFSGFLYWHLCHWHIRDDVEDAHGNILRKKMLASLRDNEWIVAAYLEQCRVDKKGYMHIGARQFGKSELMASYLAYHATLFEHTQNVIVGGNDDDLQMLRDKIDFGIRELWKGLQIPKLDQDTRKNMTRLGFKAKQGNESQIWSYLIVRNVAEGNKTEGPAGVTAKAYATDEIGKFAFAQSFEAAKPAFKSKFGWRCVPLLFGTGGSFDKGADAERFFFHPEANNFLSVIDPETGDKTAIFMSGLYRIDCKYATTLADYLIEEGIVDPDHDMPSLRRIPMQVSDKVRAREKIMEERREKAKDPDRTEYLKLIMYYPLTPKECFLSSANNFYNSTLAKLQQTKLYENDIKGTPVEFTWDGLKVGYEEKPEKGAISSFPTKKEEDLDAPAIIWEHPVPDPPFGLYVAGVDPYKFDEAKTSDSLGAVYIFKRMHDIHSEAYQDCFVASYVARPKDKKRFNEQAKLLIKYYNAQTLCENDEMSFIDYMVSEGEGHMLVDQPKWLSEFVPETTMTRPKGISRQPDKIRKHLRGLLKEYMEEKLSEKKDETGKVISTMLGISQIYDPMLLAELINWNVDGNFDREIAASLAIAQARAMDKMRIKVSDVDTDARMQAYMNKDKGKKSGPFGSGKRQAFTKRKKGNLFH